MRVYRFLGLLALVTVMIQIESIGSPVTRDPFVPVMQSPKPRPFKKATRNRAKQPVLEQKQKLNQAIRQTELCEKCPAEWQYMGRIAIHHHIRALVQQRQHMSQFFQGQQIAGTAWKIHLIGNEQLILTNTKRKSHCVLKRW